MFDIVWCRCSTLAILLQFVPHLICWSFKLESWDTSASLLLPKEKLNEGHLQQYFHLPLMDVADSLTYNRELHNIRRNKRRCTIWWWMSDDERVIQWFQWQVVGLGGTWGQCVIPWKWVRTGPSHGAWGNQGSEGTWATQGAIMWGIGKKTLQSLHKAIKNPCVLPLLLNGITRYHGIGIIWLKEIWWWTLWHLLTFTT